MSLYCGIDLHSNGHVVVVIDEQDNKIVDKRIDNNLNQTLGLLSPYREQLKAVAVESTFNGYRLVDGLIDNDFQVELVNTAAVKQYDGLKYSGDASGCVSSCPSDASGNSTSRLYLSSGISAGKGLVASQKATG